MSHFMLQVTIVSQCKCPLDCEEITFSTSIIPYSLDPDIICNDYTHLLGHYYNGNEPHVFVRLHQQAVAKNEHLANDNNVDNCKWVANTFTYYVNIIINVLLQRRGKEHDHCKI